MRSWLGNGLHDNAPHILTGDFTVAPLEHDVWSHRQLLKVVSHTPIETERLVAIMAGRNWYDVMRAHVPHTDKLYTWWSYRARDWAALRPRPAARPFWLDACYRHHRTALEVVRETRGWERSSDHVPVMVTLDLRA